ncbi:DNA-binding protein D-ETS-4 [Elysia marginata]|uniref:DNA-binding protein D-ETS-4 n=1 Tax=Elysia marginata TaxID=1093978 RepID=A0AAV4IV72_9GAST|nr:DNA-binding protein D-ETS-4 [Elysia marginata]
MSGGGHAILEDYKRQMKTFLEEHNACGQMFGLDQEVPLVRTADSDCLKTEIKTEVEPMDQHQPQVINFFGMEDALDVGHAPSGDISVCRSSLPTTIWQTPFCTSNATGYSNTDCKDSLNTPTPFCSNAVNGLKWEASASNAIASGSQSPFLSSVSFSSSSAPAQTVSSSWSLSSSQSSESSISLSSPLLNRENFLNEVSSSSSSSSSPSLSSSVSSPPFTVSLPESRFDLEQIPFARNSLSFTPQASTGSFLNELGFTATVPVSTIKFSTNITNGLAGSGCTLVSNSVNFLEDAPHQALSEDGLEYTDLDKQPFSLYEDFDMSDKQQNNNTIIYTATPNNNNNNNNNINNNNGQLLDDPELLASLHMIHDTLQKDCEELNIPFDPQLWTAEHVKVWVSALCQKKNLPDVSHQLYPLDGPTLYSMSESVLQQYGESGNQIALEIACCKAAKSIMHQETLPANNIISVYNGIETTQQSSRQTTMTSPCVSPAPSNCSNSQASSTGFSTPSDHSEDEAYFSSASSDKPKASARSASANGGRSIYLWQFLVELLVSGDPAHADCIRWIDRQKGIFKIEDSKKVAFLWGKRKNRPMMNYDKLSRSVRQYYKKGIIKKTEQSRRLVYQFCESTLANVSRSTSK